MNRQHILITGGAGFVASAMAEKLAEDENNFIVIVDNLLTGDISQIPQKENVRFIKADVNRLEDISGVFYAFSFKYVFQYAAVVGVKRTIDNPVMGLDDITGIQNILSLSKNTGVQRVFFSSSSEVYGEPVEMPQNEHTTPLNSRLPYAIVKNVGEAFLKSYKKEYDLDYTIFGDGSQTRTFCYLEDNIQACYNSFINNEVMNDVINIGNDNEMTVLELAQTIIRLSGSSSKIVHLPSLEEGDMSRRNPDISKMRKLLGRELTDIETGLSNVINNPSFIL
jgi:UDP-glucuronate decarboxylase